MILPNLAERIAWYQERLRPEDNAFGNGIADWTITAEYVQNPTVNGEPIWGCMGSPSDGGMTKLTPEDIAAKRAHIILRMPTSAAELPEVDRTLLHELGHVLVAPMQSTNRAAEENAMHSLDYFFSKLSPDEGQALARGIQTPMARAYRAEPAKDGDMPDNAPTDDKDKKEPDKPAMAQEGGRRSVAEIEQDLVKAALANQPTDDLVKELIAAKVAEMANATAAAPPAPPPPEMGMKPEDAYARKAAENTKESIEAIIEANPHLNDGQRAMARKQATAKDARELVGTYPRPSNQNEPAKLGLQNPKAGGNAPTVRARALQADDDVMARVHRAASSDDTAGLHLDVPGHILAWSPTDWLREQYGAFQRARKGAA